MLRIALCDDEADKLRETAALVQRYFQARPSVSGQVETFPGGGELLARMQESRGFDIYILDILMPGLSGIDAARKLRQLGDGGEIIYITNSNDFAADSYEVRAFSYLLKPVDEARLFKVLDGAVEKLERRRSSAVMVNTPGGMQRIRLEQILYVERMGHCMRYHCVGGVVDSQSIRLPFKTAAAPLLADRRFYLCGASFALNLQHVTGVHGQAAILDNGQTVTLPRMSAADFKKAWGKFWLEEKSAW